MLPSVHTCPQASLNRLSVEGCIARGGQQDKPHTALSEAPFCWDRPVAHFPVPLATGPQGTIFPNLSSILHSPLRVDDLEAP